jgi:hypothetical protein
MARRGTKVLQARKSPRSREDDSLLVRSAESLGRVIGSLQRQMKGTSKRVSNATEDAFAVLPELPRMDDVLKRARKVTGLGGGTRKSSGRKTSATKKRTGTRKTAGGRKRKTTKR